MQVVNKLSLPWELSLILQKDKRGKKKKKTHVFELLLSQKYKKTGRMILNPPSTH